MRQSKDGVPFSGLKSFKPDNHCLGSCGAAVSLTTEKLKQVVSLPSGESPRVFLSHGSFQILLCPSISQPARYISTGLLLHDISLLTAGNSCINPPNRSYLKQTRTILTSFQSNRKSDKKISKVHTTFPGTGYVTFYG